MVGKPDFVRSVTSGFEEADMAGGQLAESGSWHELFAMRSGRFRALCRAQGIDDHSVGRASFDGAVVSRIRRPAAVNQ